MLPAYELPPSERFLYRPKGRLEDSGFYNILYNHLQFYQEFFHVSELKLYRWRDFVKVFLKSVL